MFAVTEQEAIRQAEEARRLRIQSLEAELVSLKALSFKAVFVEAETPPKEI